MEKATNQETDRWTDRLTDSHTGDSKPTDRQTDRHRKKAKYKKEGRIHNSMGMERGSDAVRMSLAKILTARRMDGQPDGPTNQPRHRQMDGQTY